MSLIRSGISRSKAEAELHLRHAISEFETDLSTEQKATFHTTRDSSTRSPPDGQDVMCVTEEIDRRAAELLNSRRCFGPRVTNILHAIQQFAALGDVVVGGSQNIIACGIWSLVRVTLLAAVKFSSYIEQLSSLLMNIGRSAPRYERLKQLYPRSEPLQLYLYEYFIVIVRLCHKVLKLTKMSKVRQVVAFMSDADMKAFQSELDAASSLIKDEIALLVAKEVKEQGSGIKSLVRSAEADAQRQRLDTRSRVLNSCSTYDYETTWKEIRKLGSASWFREATHYKNWRASTDSASLICTGKLGSGKSVLLANIVSDLHIHASGTGRPVAYFFCRHDLVDSLNARTVMCSLARQLLLRISDLTKADEEIVSVNTPPFSFNTVLQILRRALPPTFEAYFVLDGLDECHEQQRRELVQQIRRLQEVFTLRVCVACRSDIDSISSIKPESFIKGCVMALPEENPEIKQFIRSELINRIESRKLVLGDPGLSLEIEDALVAGAQGMFLWVALQIESICASKTDEAIRRALRELPRSLPETFSRILRRSGEILSDQLYQRRTFELIIAARRPLTTSELREALSVTPGHDVWDPARLLNDVMSALICCGSLIMIDEENYTVRLIHHSVKQYLLSAGSSLNGGIMSLEHASMAMRATVFTYLNYGVFDTQLTTTVAPQISLESAPHKILRSMDTSTSSKIALKLLRSRGRQGNIDIGRAVAEAAKQFKPQPVEQFLFYAYANSYWLQHAYAISVEEKVAHKMLLKLIDRKLSCLSWKDDETHRILFWAAGEGQSDALRLCLERGADPETIHTSLGTTPLHFAATNGHEACARMLADMGANLEFADQRGRTSLSWTAGRGHQRVTDLLMGRGADIESKDNTGWTPLLWAANAGSAYIVKALLEHGADPTVKGRLNPRNGETPVSRAIEKGHTAVVKVFLDYGTDPEKQIVTKPDEDLDPVPFQGWTPLEIAVQHNKPDIIKGLIEHGASIVKAVTPETPHYNMLLRAVEYGHLTAVKALIEMGADLEIRVGGTSEHTPLSAAAVRAQPAIVKMLIDAGADIENSDGIGHTALYLATKTKDDAATNERRKALKILIDYGANKEAKDITGQTVLHWMVSQNNGTYTPNIERAIMLGFSLKATNSAGKTPLEVAAELGNLANVRLLWRDAAQLRQGDKALLYAAMNGYTAVFKCLLDRGAKLNINKYTLEELLSKDGSKRIVVQHPEALVDWGHGELRRIFNQYAGDQV